MNKLVTVVMGTRPEVIKLAPVVTALGHHGITVRVISTGQGGRVLEEMLDTFGIKPAYRFGSLRIGQSLNELTCRLLSGLSSAGLGESGLVVVQGDTASAFAGAIAGFYESVPVAHVEAGLRTQTLWLPYPEEMHRRAISRISILHFAPTMIAYQALVSEQVTGRIFKTGNTIVDSLSQFSSDPPDVKALFARAVGKAMVLLTCHRREAWRSIADLQACIKIATRLYRDLLVVWVMPPNVAIQEEILATEISNVVAMGPVAYPVFIALMRRADVIVTDSGGVIEEATTLGSRLIIIRDVTERPEAITYGGAKLVRLDALRDLPGIIMETLKEEKSASVLVFGDGSASGRIANHIANYLGGADEESN